MLHKSSYIFNNKNNNNSNIHSPDISFDKPDELLIPRVQDKKTLLITFTLRILIDTPKGLVLPWIQNK